MSPKKKVLEPKVFIFSAFSSLYLLLVYLLRTDKTMIFLLTLGYALSYIIYGFYYHIQQRNLSLKNIIEYVLIGFSILFIMRLLILNN